MSDRVSYLMVCGMAVASISGVVLLASYRKAENDQRAGGRPPSLDSTALEDRLKIFDKHK